MALRPTDFLVHPVTRSVLEPRLTVFDNPLRLYSSREIFRFDTKEIGLIVALAVYPMVNIRVKTSREIFSQQEWSDANG
jgi:hypothetical protein